MEVLYLLIPLAVVLAGVIVWFFLWAIRSGQFDDLEGPAWRVLMDDDRPRRGPRAGAQSRDGDQDDGGRAGEDDCAGKGESE